MLTDEAKDILALFGVPGIGAKTHARLLARFGSPAAVFCASKAVLMELDGIGEKTADSILTFDRQKFIDEQVRLMEDCGAVMVTRGAGDYPAGLASFKSAPPVLFVRGDVSVLKQPGIAFVGTRKPTQYGLRMTRNLVEGCIATGLSIISGMAAGVDTAAHHTAVERGGVTVAVFGCGVDTIYPSENRILATDIEKNGCLVSHFPMGTPAVAGNFPARNAVVVGLSLGTVVVEAPEKSGALITAELTLRAKRSLMTVPGNVDSPTSSGTNRLLERGARPVFSAADVVKTVGMQPVGTAVAHTSTASNAVVDIPVMDGLAGELLKVLGEGPLQIEEIGLRLGNPVAELLTELTMLEMDGHVLQRPGKVFERS